MGNSLGFRLGLLSYQRLSGVHSDLVRVVSLAVGYSAIDFTVQEGLRDLARQRVLFESGSSKTMASKHLVQSDGWGHAVDLVAIGDLDADGDIDAQDKALVWNPIVYVQIAAAVRRAAFELGVEVRWGGEFKSRDGKPWFDGPHFEIVVPTPAGVRDGV